MRSVRVRGADVKAQLAIVGLPGSGKSTLALALGRALGIDVLPTDAWMNIPWAEQADAAVLALPAHSCIVEGITVARMFKRGFEPDCVIYILGGDPARSKNSLRSLIENGLNLYSGRIITLPQWPSLETALWALGTPE